MTLYKVSYVNLRTGKHETETLASRLQFNHIDGVQKGMIVLRDFETGEIWRAYEIFAYFHRYDASDSEIQFEKGDEITDHDAVRKKLGTNKSVEVWANVNSDLTVPLFEKPQTDMPQPYKEVRPKNIRLEEYLMKHGAFSATKSKRNKNT